MSGFPGLPDTVENDAIRVLTLHCEVKFIICFDFAVTYLHVDLFVFFSTSLQTFCKTEMTNVEQTQKMIPLVTFEISLVENVSKFVLGVYAFDLDFWIQIYSIEHPVKKTRSTFQIIDHSSRLLAFVNRVRWRTNFTCTHNGPPRSTMVLSYISKNDAWSRYFVELLNRLVR